LEAIITILIEIFVAPKTGIYLFAWTVCTINDNYVMTELMVDKYNDFKGRRKRGQC
jgi:hypothetical protein